MSSKKYKPSKHDPPKNRLCGSQVMVAWTHVIEVTNIKMCFINAFINFIRSAKPVTLFLTSTESIVKVSFHIKYLVLASRKEVSVCLELPSQEKVNQTYVFITFTQSAISRHSIVAAEYSTQRTLVRFSELVEWTFVVFAEESSKLGTRGNVSSLNVPGRTVLGENLPRLDQGPAERGHREGGERLTEIDEHSERERERLKSQY